VVNAVSSNFKAVFSFVSLCNVMFCEGSKMSGSGSTPAKPVPAPSKREKAKRAERF